MENGIPIERWRGNQVGEIKESFNPFVRTAAWFELVSKRFNYLESSGDLYEYMKYVESPIIENCPKWLFKAESWLFNL